ncbi:MAG: hypothetical protein FJZ56_01595 [Chlamydiae bacterium]|nr:hypothetical protein [Chlamydiota bacterium]
MKVSNFEVNIPLAEVVSVETLKEQDDQKLPVAKLITEIASPLIRSDIEEFKNASAPPLELHEEGVEYNNASAPPIEHMHIANGKQPFEGSFIPHAKDQTKALAPLKNRCSHVQQGSKVHRIAIRVSSLGTTISAWFMAFALIFAAFFVTRSFSIPTGLLGFRSL